MEKEKIQEFFDRLAPTWDDDLVRNEAVIRTIMDNAKICAGVSVLDVACGTGVVIPDYLARGAASVTGIDISGEMIALARKKFPQENVHFLCADVETTDFGKRFDRIMVYNALPHFPSPERLVKTLSMLLSDGGVLCFAHGMSRAQINHHHEGTASAVSMGLLPASELAAIMAQYLNVCVQIDDEQMYQVAGIKSAN